MHAWRLLGQHIRQPLYTMLLTTGYLTCAAVERTDLGQRAQLVIPNREILALFRTEVLERFQLENLPTDAQKFMLAFLHGDVATVQRGLSEYLELLASTFDTAKGKEAFYHGFVLGMTAILVPNYEVQSNRESGYGRYDIAVFPKQPGGTGLVLEFKTADSEDQLAAKAQEAWINFAKTSNPSIEGVEWLKYDTTDRNTMVIDKDKWECVSDPSKTAREFMTKVYGDEPLSLW